MPLVVEKATLISHFKVVVMTPIYLVLAGILLHWVTLLILAAVVIALSFCGVVPIGLPTSEDMIAIVVFIATIMVVSLMLTIIDHFRFAGWTDESSEEAADLAAKFSEALIANDQTAVRHYVTSSTFDDIQLRNWINSIRNTLGTPAHCVTERELRTTNHVIFRNVIPILRRRTDNQFNVVAFVPVVPHLEIPIGASLNLLQLEMGNELGEFKVLDASVISIKRPALLKAY